MGIKDAFTNGVADFTKIVSNKDLSIHDILHKSNIDFSEKGIKAAAVTVIYMQDGAIAGEPDPEKPIIIYINKPFIYLIRDKKTQEIWFMGTVYTPNKWINDMKDYQYK